MSSTPPLREGMQVYGSDQQLVGTVTSINRGHIVPVLHLDDRYLVPTSALVRVEGDRLYLPNPAAQYRAQTGPEWLASPTHEPGEPEL